MSPPPATVLVAQSVKLQVGAFRTSHRMGVPCSLAFVEGVGVATFADGGRLGLALGLRGELAQLRTGLLGARVWLASRGRRQATVSPGGHCIGV
jgi:hypothetical protein